MSHKAGETRLLTSLSLSPLGEVTGHLGEGGDVGQEKLLFLPTSMYILSDVFTPKGDWNLFVGFLGSHKDILIHGICFCVSMQPGISYSPTLLMPLSSSFPLLDIV